MRTLSEKRIAANKKRKKKKLADLEDKVREYRRKHMRYFCPVCECELKVTKEARAEWRYGGIEWSTTCPMCLWPNEKRDENGDLIMTDYGMYFNGTVY